jgi:hypothetical protein
MEERATLIESLLEKAEVYAKTNADLLKLKAIDKSADLLSSLAERFIFMKVFSLVVIMTSVGVALWVGELMGKMYFGFLSVALFYLVVGGIAYIFRKSFIKTPLNNAIISEMFKEKNKLKYGKDQ